MTLAHQVFPVVVGDGPVVDGSETELKVCREVPSLRIALQDPRAEVVDGYSSVGRPGSVSRENRPLGARGARLGYVLDAAIILGGEAFAMRGPSGVRPGAAALTFASHAATASALLTLDTLVRRP